MQPLLRWLIVGWGLAGVLTLLGRALVSLTPLAIEALLSGLAAWQIALAITWAAFMAYSEGYRGFQKRFSPMVAARLLVLRDQPNVLRVVLAPLFCMGLIDATRRRLIVSWSVLIGVIGLVLAVRLLPQPWRGIVDLGVVVGLGWGTVSLLLFSARALLTGQAPGDSELAVPASGLDAASA